MFFEKPSTKGSVNYSAEHYYYENIALVLFIVAALSSIKANQLHIQYKDHPTREYKRKVYELGNFSAFLILVASIYFFMDNFKHYNENTSEFKQDYLIANALTTLGAMIRYAAVVQETPSDYSSSDPY